jgi:toxin-antitoxin system PIN domain toxin
VEVGTVDANLLIYAYNDAALQHRTAKHWLSTVLGGTTTVFLSWNAVQAFLRIITNDRLFKPPLTPAEAADAAESWLRAPNVRILEPGPRYWTILRELIVRYNIRGPLVTDAHLAALAIEHDVTLFTADADFRRFAGLKTRNPLLTA